MSQTRHLSSAASSEMEAENFEDAPDTASRPQSSMSHQSASIRSLTDRPPSLASHDTPRPSNVTAPSDQSPLSKGVDLDSKINEADLEQTTGTTLNGEGSSTNGKSPLLTAHRISTASLDDVQLGENEASESGRSRSTTITSNKSTGQDPASAAPKPPSRPGLSGSFPTIPWGPPSTKPIKASPTPPPNPTASRKLTMPFSWLSRNSSTPKENKPLPANMITGNMERRGTVTSIASVGGNPELMLNHLDDGNESDSSGTQWKRDSGSSLRDRFKMLRMREEAGIQSLEGMEASSPAGGGAIAGLIGRSASMGLGIASPRSVAENKELSLASAAQSPAMMSPPEEAPENKQSVTKADDMTSADAALPPGTASGAVAGPSTVNDPDESVDWDLWQNVVYEGPAAVAKTSPEELRRAIAAGIPSAIRGVIWQVLARSKNEDLEGVYRDLVNRGTDKDQDSVSITNGSSSANGIANGHLKEKPSITSSASSIHSEKSTPATTATMGMGSPSLEKDQEAMMKLQAAMVAERKQKAKDDAAALTKLEKVIKRDMGSRTSYSKYAAAANRQEGLFGVCKAYALFDEGVGYAQGMNFLVMPLLLNMPDEEAFCLLVRLMNQYHLRDLFIKDMPGLHLHLYQFERLLEDTEPALYCHLHRRNVSPQLYATQWFLTLFAYRFPLQLVLRVYDLILSEGLEGAILKFGIVLMQKNAETLLGMTDMSTLTTFLKEKIFDVYIDSAPSSNSILESGFFGSSGGSDKEVYRADMLVQDACAVQLTPELLKTYTAEWEEKQRLEHEREAELENLRSSNASFGLRIRALEERTQKSDTEHVQMASELVRTKVENQELMDQVESLKGQTEEYKTLMDKQEQEVETRMKAEVERIMQRNAEVQSENRGLEEQMSEMEKELVAVKMQHAELNGEYEDLKRKWGDMRKMLG